jgi:small subunit ribosomal protein S7
MARDSFFTPPKYSVDPQFKSPLVMLFALRILRNGKKDKALSIIYDALKISSKVLNQEPLVVLESAIKNTTPKFDLKSRRVKGTMRRIPIEINRYRGSLKSINWILESAKEKTGKSMAIKLSREISDAAKGVGTSVKKCGNLNQMALSNRSFLNNAKKKKRRKRRRRVVTPPVFIRRRDFS